MKRRILLGTANQAKINRFRAYLATLPIEILSLGDLGIARDVEEDGKTPQENAEIKARAYFAESNIPTLAVDAGLTIERFPNEKQPGVFVRRIRGTGEAVSDEEILGYYARELDRIGGETVGKWEVGIALVTLGGKTFSHTFDLQARFTATRSAALKAGEPLSSLMTDPTTGKYYSELADEERPDSRWIREFVSEHLEEL
jgi:inosine/xanthosine triphosphate pyrophosphatase family protein